MNIQIQIVTWNSESVISNLLTSIKRQTKRPYRIVIIDNGSTDHTIERCKTNNDVLVIKQEMNIGFTGGHNRGFFIGRDADAVVCLNPDVVLFPDALENLIRAFKSRTDIGSVGGKLLRPSSLTSDPKLSIIDTAGIKRHATFQFTDISSQKPDSPEIRHNRIVEANSGACVLIPTKYFSQLELSHSEKSIEIFDNRFFAYKEDIDLGMRIQRKGLVNINTGIAIGTHQRSLKADIPYATRSQKGMYYSYRNHLYLLRKHVTLPLFLKYGIFIIGYECAKVAMLAITRPAILFSAWKEALQLRTP